MLEEDALDASEPLLLLLLLLLLHDTFDAPAAQEHGF